MPPSPSSRYIVVHAPAGFEGYPKRRTHYFKTQNAAKEFRIQIRRWKEDQKHPPLEIELSETDKRWIAFLQNRLGDLSLLPEVVTHWEKTAKTIKRPLAVHGLCDEYVAYRKTRNIAVSTLADDKWVCAIFAGRLNDLRAHDVTTLHVRQFLDSAPSQSSAKKFYKVVSQMFDYAREQHIIILNPCADIKRPQVAYKDPEIIRPAVFKTLLEGAKAQFSALLPYLALAGFAGLRREELLREYRFDQILRWEDFYWDRGLIEVRAQVAKKTSRKRGDRRFPPIEPALAYWLKDCRQESGDVVALSDSWFRRQYARLCSLVGHIPKQNELRHSYASFWLARSTMAGVGQLAKQMGNSEAVARKHYIEVLSPADGEAWFGIR
jgi:integrase